MLFRVLLLCSVAIATEAGNCHPMNDWEYEDGTTYRFTGVKFESIAANNVGFVVYVHNGSSKRVCRSVGSAELQPTQGWIHVSCTGSIDGDKISLKATGLIQCGEKVFAIGSLIPAPTVPTTTVRPTTVRPTVPSCNVSPTTSERTVCEHAALSLSCPAGKLLKIVFASYGRHDRTTCRGAIHTTNCHAASSLVKLRQMCDNRQSCRLAASNSVFGDPCVHTYKYLKVKSQCVSPGTCAPTTRANTVCEHAPMSLSCPAGKVLNIVESSYGRRDRTTCPSRAIYTTNCHACNSLEKMKQRCDNRRSCQVSASNSVFGDPCVNTYKYLKVKSQCVSPGTGTCGDVKKTKKVCEHQYVRISCPSGKKIKVDTASYGGGCPGNNPVDSGCHACSSLSKVKLSCEGKQSCSIKASNGIFGDPCHGTFKRLKVVYTCC